jgi:hypothetical protein
MSRVNLVFFEGCPHVDQARAHLAEALRRRGLTNEWREWDLMGDSLPAEFCGYGSPTVLVDGRDVCGTDPVTDSGPTCRAGGAPGVDQIQEALSR